MLPTDECDDCRPDYLQRRLDSVPLTTIAISSLPFIITFIVVAVVVAHRLFPRLAGPATDKEQEDGLPSHTRDNAADGKKGLKGLKARLTPSRKRVATITFATSIALSSVLVELLLCEISNTLNPAVRGLALRVTLSSLLFLILVLTPSLEIHSVVARIFRSPEGASTGRKRYWLQHFVASVLLKAWLVIFWYLPHTSVLPAALHQEDGEPQREHDFVEECLERIGIIGIALMASLAGFAAVSSIWQTLGARHRTVRQSDIARKEQGLASTKEMLATKRSRLRALRRKMSQSAQDQGLVTRMMGSIRGTKDSNEQRALEMEISGLETMATSLASSLSNLHSRIETQQQSHTLTGRCLNAFNVGFALYCLYRIAATSISSLRRWWQPNSTFATSDPINNVLAILTTHYDPTLDRLAWSRQISFALSGVMLLASFNAVLQTFRLFTRFAPSLLQHTQTSLPLVISQVAGTYVISSALLLRSNLPPEVSSVITEALGAPLEGRFVEGWFESWFLVAVGLTATGVLVSRKVGSGDWDEWDDAGDIELGKMN